MSDVTPQREWHFYIDDMIGFCDRALEYSRGFSQEQFLADPMRMDATVRNVELIGEAATHLPESVRLAWPAVPWRKVVATRKRLIHGYLGIDNDTLWSIVSDDIPALASALRDMKAGIRA